MNFGATSVATPNAECDLEPLRSGKAGSVLADICARAGLLADFGIRK
jgi:hypothetical protein